MAFLFVETKLISLCIIKENTEENLTIINYCPQILDATVINQLSADQSLVIFVDKTQWVYNLTKLAFT